MPLTISCCPVPEYSRMILQQHNGLKCEQMILCQEERTMTKLDFTIPFSGFASTTFINCFTSVYMYLEGMRQEDKGVTRCSQWENGQCSSCIVQPSLMQCRKDVFLFDTICGHSSLRCAYDGCPVRWRG